MRSVVTLFALAVAVGCGKKPAPVAESPKGDPKPPAVAQAPRGGPTVSDILLGGDPPKADPKPPMVRPEPPKPPDEDVTPPKTPNPDPMPPVKPDNMPKPARKLVPPGALDNDREPPKVAVPQPPKQRANIVPQDMNDIHVFVDNYSGASGQMPSIRTIFDALVNAGSPAARLVESGDILLTGARERESCWAFEKDAMKNGGWIVTNSGADQVDAAAARRAITGR